MVFLFSLAGIPPLAGFVGKFYLFAAVIQQKFYLLALVGVLNSVVSLYCYDARIVRTMFLDFPAGGEGTVAVDLSNGILLWLPCTIVLGVYWAPVIDLANRSIRFIMRNYEAGNTITYDDYRAKRAARVGATRRPRHPKQLDKLPASDFARVDTAILSNACRSARGQHQATQEPFARLPAPRR